MCWANVRPKKGGSEQFFLFHVSIFPKHGMNGDNQQSEGEWMLPGSFGSRYVGKWIHRVFPWPSVLRTLQSGTEEKQKFDLPSLRKRWCRKNENICGSFWIFILASSVLITAVISIAVGVPWTSVPEKKDSLEWQSVCRVGLNNFCWLFGWEFPC